MVCELYFNKLAFLMVSAHTKHGTFPMDILDKRTESSGVFVAVLFVTAMPLVGQLPRGTLATMI